MPKRIQLSKNWFLDEFHCRCEDRGYHWCGGAAPIQERLVDLLQRIRDRAGVSLYCVHSSNPEAGSGFRCIPYNTRIGGVPESYHMRGMAADIWSKSISALEIYTIALEVFEQLGYGRAFLYADKNFVHIDIGEPRNGNS